MRHYFLNLFLLAWLLYFLILALLPATYSGGSYFDSVFYLSGFVLGASATFLLLMSRVSLKGNLDQAGFSEPKYLNKMILACSAFSVYGVLLLMYDRILVQGVDYTHGIAFAREYWRAVGEVRAGVSSILSFVGNLLSGFPIVLLALLYLYYEKLSFKLRALSVGSMVFSLAASALLSGGRSTVLIFILSLMLIGFTRKYKSIGVIPKSIRPIELMFSIFSLAAFLFYMVYVFHLRAVESGRSSLQYLLSHLERLGGRYTGNMEGGGGFSFFNDVLNYLNLVGTYLVHSVWTFQSILNLEHYEGAVTFSFYRMHLSRIFGFDIPVDWEFAGLFSTFPGAFYYDYGVVGAVLSSLATGVLIFCATLILYRRTLSPLHIGAFLACMYIALLSPLVFAADMMVFPFVLFDFLLIYLMFYPGARVLSYFKREG